MFETFNVVTDIVEIEIVNFGWFGILVLVIIISNLEFVSCFEFSVYLSDG
jgi:hypothetical protein